MKKSLAQHKSLLKGEFTSVRKFHVEITYLRTGIDKAISELPKLRKLIVHYEKMLPIWQDDLVIREKSLKLHLKFLQRYQTKHDLAAKIDSTRRKLRTLNQELQKMI